MIKPQNYDNTQIFRGFEPLQVGGHICKIVNVEETESKQGRPMIVIYFDTAADDVQPNYFSNSYKNDQREDKKWPIGGRIYQLVLDADGNCNKGFKTFVDAVKENNPGFNENCLWGNEPINKFLKGKLFGGLFGREEYLNNYGESKFSVKFQGFRTIKQVKDGLEAPEDKLLNPTSNYNSTNSFSNSNYSGEMTPIDEGDMPF